MQVCDRTERTLSYRYQDNVGGTRVREVFLVDVSYSEEENGKRLLKYGCVGLVGIRIG